MNDIIITAQDVHVSYNGLQAVKDISMEIPRNKITALIGASGSGKSTFLRSLNRMLDTIPNAKIQGNILFNGYNILEKDTDVIELRTRVGMVFQTPVPFPKSIYENIAYGLKIQGVTEKRNLDTAVTQSLRDAALWDEVKDRLHESALKLSGGQKQRLCIARMLAIKPDVLLLDEPCSALDPISTRKIEDLLLDLKKKYTVIIVTHNMHQARRISDYTG
ncbi:MAG: phosphate ABC transporter ATP-binding protein, partial [Candidatus Andersenbacteria bacterium]